MTDGWGWLCLDGAELTAHGCDRLDGPITLQFEWLCVSLIRLALRSMEAQLLVS